MRVAPFVAVGAALAAAFGCGDPWGAGAPTKTPAAPTGLSAVAVSPTEIRLSWFASAESGAALVLQYLQYPPHLVARRAPRPRPPRRAAVTTGTAAGYLVFRNSVQIGSTDTTSYSDAGLAGSTTYTYQVAAYDDAGRVSAKSAPATATTPAEPSSPGESIRVGPTGRYLVDSSNAPFMIVGDSPHSLIGNLSEAEADAYFANRRAAGFNSVWVELLCNAYTGCNADGTTYDGVAPFTTAGDFATPNEAYFARADAAVRLAAQYGIVVFLDPIDTAGWIQTLRQNGVTKAFNYGAYLGKRFKDFANIVWMNGNDFQTWRTESDDALVQAVARGIQSIDKNHIHTVQLDYFVSSSLDDPSWAPLISLNAAYTYYPTYAEVLKAYGQSSSMPVFMAEANYEFEHNFTDQGTPSILRRQEYWSALCGATGQFYGSYYTWRFTDGWQSQLDTPGVVQLGYMKKLFASRQWYNLVPDQYHTVLTDGYGSYASRGTIAADDYATAAATPDGSLVIVYMPTRRSITMNMASLSGAAQAKWYDPTNGTYIQIAGSPFPNSDSRQFTPPGDNSAGDGDWILVLEK